MKGNLYVITNSVNDKVYVGKTYRTIEERFKEHILESKRERSKNRDIYKAMNTLGVDKFHINLLGQFDEGILEEKECEYIKLYDSYHNGYNNTLGGDGKRYVEFTDEEAIEVYKKYNNLTKASKELNCDVYTLKNILKNNDVKIMTTGEYLRKKIECSNGMIFESVSSAADWLLENNICPTTNKRCVSVGISKALKGKRKGYLKFKWSYV